MVLVSQWWVLVWECVYPEGEKARSTVQVDAGTREEIQEGDVEAGKTVGQEALEAEVNPWILTRKENTRVKTGNHGTE